MRQCVCEPYYKLCFRISSTSKISGTNTPTKGILKKTLSSQVVSQLCVLGKENFLLF